MTFDELTQWLKTDQGKQSFNLQAGMPWSQLLGQVITDPSQLVPGAHTMDWMKMFGHDDKGNLTLDAQNLTGWIGDKATTAEQGIMSGVINNIMQMNNSPANPFTYLSKLRGINQLGPISSFLRGAFTGATGQTPAQLAKQQTILNNQLMPTIYGNMFNNMPGGAAQTGNVLNPGVPVVGQDPSLMAYANALPGLTQAAGLPSAEQQQNMQAQGNVNQGTPGGLPTGWGTSGQQMKNLDPSLQGAFMDAIQNAGGQNPDDFKAGMAAAMPGFRTSAGAQTRFSQF